MHVPEIEAFLQKRKEDWLKSKIKSNTPPEAKQTLEQEAEQKFHFTNWVQDAAKRAGQLSMVSHPAKFSHPSAKSTNIIAHTQQRPDGLLRSGNIKGLTLDVFGNAAALDVYKFLMLNLNDNKPLLEHLEANTLAVRQLFATFSDETFEEIRQNFLKIKTKESPPKTHGKIKQIYFPLDQEGTAYHLLSILTPSPILYELKKRIQTMRFSEAAKASREARKNAQAAAPYSDILNLTRIGFGGTKPQNISVLNNQNGGIAYLLPASPPVLKKRHIHPPVKNFFDHSYTRPLDYQDLFDAFHNTLKQAINNKHTRNKIQKKAKDIFSALIERSWHIRHLDAGWSDSDRYQTLPQSQKWWLDQKYHHSEHKDEEWLNNLEENIITWFGHAYQSLYPKQNYNLSDHEFIALKKWLKSYEGGLK
ncbi:MAG TPA: type I-F CRISPR-associated protein Csy1 [Chromatiaceae bacterium]|nr:type I-F CRISPR-associated protein Csy1 [Chromatiaceae bacterium]